MVRSRRGRVVFASASPGSTLTEQAAQLRRAGFDAVLVTTPATSWRQRAQRLVDRLAFDEIWPELQGEDLDATVSPSTMRRILSAPTLDVRAHDYLGVQLASLRHGEGIPLRIGLPAPEWYDKRFLADRLVELGIPGPEVWDTPTTDAFPVVVKARITSGGAGVRICHDEAELGRAWAELDGDSGAAFVQEFLPGQAYSVAGVAVNGEVVAHETYQLIKPPGEPTAPSINQLIVDRPDITEIAVVLLRAVGHTGLFSLNQIEDAEGRGRPCDLNPRCPGSWISLCVAGSTMADAYLALLDDLPVPTGEPLRAGTVGGTLRLMYAAPWASWDDFADWWRTTGALIRARRGPLGARYVAWAEAMRLRQVWTQLRARARGRGNRRSAAIARQATTG